MLRTTILALLADRRQGATICPSEAARMLGDEDWRARMGEVHAEVARLADEGVVRVSWRRGARQVGDGAYRVGLAEGGEA